MSRLLELAAAAPVSVFPAIGTDAAAWIDELAVEPDITLAPTPRHANVLLIAGAQRGPDRSALWRVHDQLPHPRGTFCWGADHAELHTAETVRADEDPRPKLRSLHRALMTGAQTSEADLLPDEPPNPWRGHGEFGQGGEGMMGGTPYGRMMPMPPTRDLRDGLMLDVYTATVGPYLPALPPGLALEITWQGDIIQSARMVRPPLGPSARFAAPFHGALEQPVSLATLERHRAAHHLGCVARLLALLELHRLARRCREFARRARLGEAIDDARLSKAIHRSGAFAAIPAGLGRCPESVLGEIGGVASRAAGRTVDVRSHQRDYHAVGFEPVAHRGGDVRARLQQWLAETRQALELAAHARGATPVRSGHAVESPWGALGTTGRHEPAHVGFDFTDLLVGREWHEALLILASFDAATLARMIRWQPSLLPPAGE